MNRKERRRLAAGGARPNGGLAAVLRSSAERIDGFAAEIRATVEQYRELPPERRDPAEALANLDRLEHGWVFMNRALLDAFDALELEQKGEEARRATAAKAEYVEAVFRSLEVLKEARSEILELRVLH